MQHPTYSYIQLMKIPSSNVIKSIFLAGLVATYAAPEVQSADWKYQAIKLPQPVAKISQSAQTSVLIKTKSQSYRAIWHKGELHLKKVRTVAANKAPKGGLPDGGIAHYKSSSITSAWYAAPTRRYDHGIMGDSIEAAALVAKDNKGNVHRYQLDKNSVFEDLTPRLVDLDGDGKPEVITIRSFLDKGASLAVFGLVQNKLKLLATTPPIGLSHRWLNVAGTGDFNKDGAIDIAIVVTPHIGGTLEIWSYKSGKLQKTASMHGFSNHFIGSRNLNLSYVADVNGDGKPDIAVPGASRRALRIMSLTDNKLSQLASIPLSHRITQNIGYLPHPTKQIPLFLLGLSNGQLLAVSNR